MLCGDHHGSTGRVCEQREMRCESDNRGSYLFFLPINAEQLCVICCIDAACSVLMGGSTYAKFTSFGIIALVLGVTCDLEGCIVALHHIVAEV